jgi:hypothetical protein
MIWKRFKKSHFDTVTTMKMIIDGTETYTDSITKIRTN